RGPWDRRAQRCAHVEKFLISCRFSREAAASHVVNPRVGQSPFKFVQLLIANVYAHHRQLAKLRQFFETKEAPGEFDIGQPERAQFGKALELLDARDREALAEVDAGLTAAVQIEAR